ncbi:peptide synthetase [Colletotrichum godetiae]|uniref:Peptide synthetase n=1 Tax=Colletotrichum godetiae TaxID=1209918 RepID=A0AAJ0EV24_9PEZI|nr:peptide synthetase [Colletotrichum godetiae]KAK1674918.1 peptide synthetase [Colletotrichum godetiae]
MAATNAPEGRSQAIINQLKTFISKILIIPLEDIDEASSFVTLGGDSFKAVHLYQKCAEQGLGVRFQDILHKPLGEVASLASDKEDESCSTKQVRQGDAKFPQMSLDYDFGKIFDELRKMYGVSDDDVEDIYPCSPMQESMYVGQKMVSKRLYRTRGLFEAQAGFDLDQFQKCWSDAIHRHQTLRTVYVETSDTTSGRLLDSIVLKSKSEPMVIEHVRDLEGIRHQFTNGDLDEVHVDKGRHQHQITVYVDVQEPDQILILMDLNHLTVDGSSLMIIIDELVRGLQGSRLLDQAPGYGKYIDHLQAQTDEDGALDYWVDYLDGTEPCTFPAMNDNQVGNSGSFNVTEMGLDVALDDIRAFCQKQNATISNVLQAVWSLVLHTYTGDPDICFGYLSSGRSLPIPGVSQIVGPMMNLLVCRVGGIDNMSLQGLLETTRKDFLNALPHQCFSIGKVQRILGTNEMKLFNTIMTSYYSPSMSDDSSSNFFKLISSHNASDFDIVLKIVYSDSEIRVRLAYSTATLSTAMATNVSYTFSSILSRLIRMNDTQAAVSSITAISSWDMRQVTAWNSHSHPPSPKFQSTCVHHLIEGQVRVQPNASAIHSWDGHMTYKELDEAASIVAREILRRGIGPGAFVAICFEKLKWYSVALLGVLKSGNAFAPVDISNPESRRKEILHQLGIYTTAGLVICSRKQEPSIKHLAGQTLQLDGDQSSPKEDFDIPLPSVSSNNPAYVIFTSGSTGKPKGVVVEHGAYAYAAQAHSKGIHIDSASRVLQFASYGFDTSMEDHLTTFSVGACLCVPSEDDRLSCPDLARFASASGANWAHLTPSFAEMFTPVTLSTMRTMVLGGEAMTAKNVQNWACPPQTQLVQVYGPSECSVTSTISPPFSKENSPTNIGFPVPGCAAYVARSDDPNILQAVGAVGELLMEGPILARGYLGDSAQTSISFVKSLRWAPGKRLYRTGDLVKYDSAGLLHFVGRRDLQVKLRGQRIELGEIERQLGFERRVQHCLALVPESGPCAKRLVAVITLDSSFVASPTDVSASPIEILDVPWLEHIDCMRGFLLDKLPPYMNPELWIILKSLPRNSSGKLDRKGVTKYLEGLTPSEFASLLPRMDDDSPERQGTDAEVMLRSIWSEALNVGEDEICWNTSFYHLGGDSISAMTISSMARETGLNVSAADILRYRSIERLAKSVVGAASPASAQTDTSEDPVEAQALILSPIQKLHFQTSPEGDHLDQQTMLVEVTQTVDQQDLLAALESLLVAHPILCAQFKCHGGEWTQHVPVKSTISLVYYCRTRFHSRTQLEYVIECVSEAKRSIHLTNGPLVAVDLFESQGQTLLSMTIHHLVVDAVSWRILLRELESCLRFGMPVVDEKTSFQHWTLEQQRFASNSLPQDVLPPSAHALSTDLSSWGMADERNCFKDSVSHTISLDSNVSRQLISAQETSGHEAHDILLTAVIQSFVEIFGRSPALFSEGHGREVFAPDVDPSSTVGWFTTFSPIVTQECENILSGVREFRDKIPLSGLAYFASRFLSKAGEDAYKHHHPMEVTLNHLGAFQQFEKKNSLFKRCTDEIQDKVSALRYQQRAKSSRYALISIMASIKDNKLSLQVEWNSRMHHQELLLDWLHQLEKSLTALVVDLTDEHQRLPLSPSEVMVSSIGLHWKELNNILDLAQSRFGITPSEIEVVLPCSPIQDSLMLSQLKSVSNHYSQHFLFKLSGSIPLNPDDLSAAWKLVVATHQILRTIFVEDTSGKFLQLVLKAVEVDIQVQRLRSESDLPALWAKQSSSIAPKPLSGKILHKLQIYAATNGSMYCLLDKNHIITDGTTSRLLIRNFLAALDGCPRQDTCPYSNYIDYVQDQDTAEITRYWSRYLDGASSCLFPVLRQHRQSSVEGLEFTGTSSTFPKSSLSSACRKLDMTVPIVFQAAWSVVLSTYLNSDDVIFGLLNHGRDIPIPGASEIIGPMTNIVPVRVQIGPRMEISKILTRLQEDNLDHLSRQTVSLARIQHAAKRTSGDALFNTIFNFQKTGSMPGPGAIKSELLFAHDRSEYDIALCITEDQGQFHITIETPTHFMSEAQAERLLVVYVNAVRTIVDDPGAQTSEIRLTSALDDKQMQEWNSAPLKTNNRCIHDMISETVNRQPLRPAICAWDGDLSYAEVDTLSMKLASRLQALRVAPGDIVVICFEKSLWAVVAMLAVAKSGAAFVHIDPNGAAKRNESVVKQTGSRIGLSSPKHSDKLQSLVKTLVVVDKSSIEKDSSFIVPLNCSATPLDTLYVIFTSGTTGTPKGVMIQHKSFCSAVAYNRTWLQIKAESRVLQFTNFCFDASLEEIFTVLVAGGCICIPSEEERLSDIPGFVARKQVNWAAFTPSFLRTLDPDDLESVKFITVHAEPMGQDLVARWAGKIHMRPSYGPTECSVTSTIGAPFDVDTDATNIGWPVGCRAWVVHPENHHLLMPVGAVGELLLDGPIVGKGYLNDDAKTATAFIEPPLWTVDKALPQEDDISSRRLYKTGDLVRYAEDGSLLIQRRKDHAQVKIRGQRVELGEIQYHLNNLSGIIQHSMVLVPEVGNLRGRLVAVVSLAVLSLNLGTRDYNQDIAVVEKRTLSQEMCQKLNEAMNIVTSALEKELPQYMIPETWLLVKTLPVQLSLKLDRQRVMSWVGQIDEQILLDSLDLHQTSGSDGQSGSPTEETLRDIWANVLGLDSHRIGLEQSFFRLGGDSIFAMQVMRLCKAAALNLTTQDVLANPTIKLLAQKIATRVAGHETKQALPRSMINPPSLSQSFPTPDNVETMAPCSPFQKRMYQAFLGKPQSPYLFNSLVELTAIRGSSSVDTCALHQAWQQTVNRHAILRTVFVHDLASETVFQKVLKQQNADVSVLDVKSEGDATNEARLHLNAIRSKLFRDESPAVSVRLFVIPDEKTFIHFVMGHILIDHVSLAHVFSDFVAFYRGQNPGAKPLSSFHGYIDHINSQRDLQASEAYWVDKLQSVKPYMVPIESMVVGGSDPHTMGSINFSVDITVELKQFLCEAGVTLSNLFQFTWGMLLHVYTGHSTVCFGHLVSDRDIELPQADEVVGPMLSMMVACNTFDDTMMIIQVLQAFQDENIHSLNHKTFDLTEVERQLGCEGTGLFNTLVNYRKVKYSDDDIDIGFRSIWKQDPHEQLLVLAFNEGPSRLDATLTYYESLFSETTMKTLTHTYRRLLDLLVNCTTQTVGDVKTALTS